MNPLKFLSLTLICLLAACQSAPVNPPPTVASVDLQRYLGTWLQQGLIPNRFQKQCVRNTTATYAQEGGAVSVTNRCVTADGKLEETQGTAKIVDGSNNAKLRVSFFWPFYGDYWVLALDPQYQWVLVGEPRREFGWVLSRTPLDDAAYNAILDRAVALGYDRAKFERSVNQP